MIVLAITCNSGTFIGFLLKGLRQSANIEFEICPTEDRCFPGGYFTLLGGSAEKGWEFDRLYKYEITDQVRKEIIFIM